MPRHLPNLKTWNRVACPSSTRKALSPTEIGTVVVRDGLYVFLVGGPARKGIYLPNMPLANATWYGSETQLLD